MVLKARVERPYAIGVDLGGSSVKAVAVTRSGQLLAKTTQTFPARVRLGWAEVVREAIECLERKCKGPVASIGLSAPGLAARDARSIASMPGRLQGLEGLEWTRFLKRRSVVPVLNDAHAALLGEYWRGAARGFANVCLITLGTGVGGAILSEGKLMTGTIGRAGHFGHTSLDAFGKPDITGTPGSLEDAMGNCTLPQRSNHRFANTHELVAQVGEGNVAAHKIWIRSVRQLAAGIVSLINVIDPEAVIIGGGIARARGLLFIPLRRFVREMEWQAGGQRVRILPAALGELAGAYGAAYRSFQKPRDRVVAAQRLAGDTI